jgi:hypothetical protein
MAALKAKAGMADHFHFNERSRHGRMVGSGASVASSFNHAPAGAVRGVGTARATGTTGEFSALPHLSAII